MRITAILTAYNEQRFIAACIEHLHGQGVGVYLVDNESTDATVAIAERYLGRGLIGIETLPRAGMYQERGILAHKEGLAATLDSDWFMHIDADEIHLPPHARTTLAQAFAAVEARGYNAVNFLEFTFTPTSEAPDHDHPDFLQTMRWYYPFAPRYPHLVRAWKRQDGPVDLCSSGGHQLRFPGLRLYPEPFKMRHYLFLSVPHVIEKYTRKTFDPREVRDGWHGWRAQLTADAITLPSCAELRLYDADDTLSTASARITHYLADALEAFERRQRPDDERERFFIKPGYAARAEAQYFDDTDAGGIVYQPDAYPFAAHLARRFGCDTIIDIGCGAAQKLAVLHPEFNVVGIDIGPNIAHCRVAYPFGTWIEHDLECGGALSLGPELLRRSVIICADVIEHLVDPTNLLRLLRSALDHAAAALLTTPERDLVHGPDDPGPPANPAHVREWNLDEFQALLRAEGLTVEFAGLTLNNSVTRQKRTSLVVLANHHRPPIEPAPSDFRVVALVAAFNAEDVVPVALRYLLDQGVAAYLLDAGSTDGTVAAANALATGEAGCSLSLTSPPIQGEGLIGAETIPASGDGRPDWDRVMRRIEDLSADIEADWFIVQDAAELRAAPWSGVTLRDALWRVEREGFTTVEHTVIEFPVFDDEDLPPQERELPRFAFGAGGASPGPWFQCWRRATKPRSRDPRNPRQQVGPAAGVYPYNFLLQRYPTAIRVAGDRLVVVYRDSPWGTTSGGECETAPRPAIDLCPYAPERFQPEFLVERLSGVGVARDDQVAGM